MNWKSVNIFWSFAFLVFIVCSAILPVSGFQNNMSISSHGTVNYSKPSPNTWNLVMTVTPIDGGTTSISAAQSIPVGQGITVTATPNQGYTFLNWKFDGTNFNSNPITITSQSAGTKHTLVANFKTQVIQTRSYGLFAYHSDLSSQFLSRIAAGRIDRIWVEVAHWTGQRLEYEMSDAQITNFVTQIKNANPSAKVMGWIWAQSGLTSPLPDLTSSSNRQTMINQLITCVNKGLDGIQDDTEGWVGSNQNHFDYFNEAATAIQNLGRLYYPWVHPTWMPSITAQISNIGAYGDHAWDETQYKNYLDYCQKNAKDAFFYTLMAEAGYTSINQQLTWLDQKIAEHGPYSKLNIGLYYYPSMTDSDWTAWNNWVTKA